VKSGNRATQGLSAADVETMRFRNWKIQCPGCGHTGDVLLSLRRVREVKWKCSACGKAGIEAVESP